MKQLAPPLPFINTTVVEIPIEIVCFDNRTTRIQQAEVSFIFIPRIDTPFIPIFIADYRTSIDRY